MATRPRASIIELADSDIEKIDTTIRQFLDAYPGAIQEKDSKIIDSIFRFRQAVVENGPKVGFSRIVADYHGNRFTYDFMEKIGNVIRDLQATGDVDSKYLRGFYRKYIMLQDNFLDSGFDSIEEYATFINASNSSAAVINDSSSSKSDEEFEMLKEELRSLTNNLGSAAAELREHEKKVESASKKWLQEVDGLKKTTRDELDSLVSSLETRIGTDAAQKLWKTKNEEHDSASWLYLKRLLIALGVGTVSFPFLVWILASILDVSLTDFSAGLIVVLFLPLVALLWLLRLIAGLYRSNRDRADDAAERVAMIETFISLQAHGGINEEERAVVLQALFRPFARGPEETLPNPAWEAIIKRIEQSKQATTTGS